MRDQLATANLSPISTYFSWPLSRHLDWGLFNGQMVLLSAYMEVSWNGDTPKSSMLIDFSTINHPFLGYGTPIYGEKIHWPFAVQEQPAPHCCRCWNFHCYRCPRHQLCDLNSSHVRQVSLSHASKFQLFRSCQLIHNQWNIKHQSPVKHQTSSAEKSVPRSSFELEGEVGSASAMRSSFCFGSSWPSLGHGLKRYRWPCSHLKKKSMGRPGRPFVGPMHWPSHYGNIKLGRGGT